MKLETKAGIEELKAIVEENPSDYDAQKEFFRIHSEEYTRHGERENWLCYQAGNKGLQSD